MSTRSQIEFKHVTKYLKRKRPIIERRTVYRHSDGYPEGVIPDIKEFLKWNNGRNGDIEYQVANFIYWSKRWHEERYWKDSVWMKEEFKKNPNLKWSDNHPTNCSSLHIGFGVCENDGFHGDIAYFYEVVLEVTEVKGKEYKKELKIFIYEPKVKTKENSQDFYGNKLGGNQNENL